MASANAQKDATGSVSVAEGVSTTIPYKGSMHEIIDQIRGGLGSGCSYSGVSDLKNLFSISDAVKVSSAGIGESRPHALVI
jgi:IMP dehydrogenase